MDCVICLLIDPHISKSYVTILLYGTALSSKEQNSLVRSCSIFLSTWFYFKYMHTIDVYVYHTFFFIAVVKLVNSKRCTEYIY